jgi:alpha-tubulin suppressor-like RCC1 family protein
MDVAAGRRHTCGLLEDGRVVCWGSPDRALEAPDTQFFSIEAGESVTCGRSLEDELVCWGWSGEPPSADDDGDLAADLPDKLTNGVLYDVGSIGGQFEAQVCMQKSKRSKRVHCYAQGDRNDIELAGPRQIHDLSTAGRAVCATMTRGLLCDGYFKNPPVGHGDFEPTEHPADIACGPDHCCTLGFDGKVACFGYKYEQGDLEAPGGSYDRIIAGGNYYTCVRQKGGETVSCWGESDSEVAEQTPEGLAVEVLGGGAYHACAIRKSDGYIDCWGSNDSGQATAPTPTEAVEMLQSE